MGGCGGLVEQPHELGFGLVDRLRHILRHLVLLIELGEALLGRFVALRGIFLCQIGQTFSLLLGIARRLFLLEGQAFRLEVQLLAEESGSIGLVLDSDSRTLLLVLSEELVEDLVATLSSHRQLVGIENFIEWFDVTNQRELSGVLGSTVTADVGAVGHVHVVGAVVLAVHAESVELILLHDLVDVNLLIVRLLLYRQV